MPHSSFDRGADLLYFSFLSLSQLYSSSSLRLHSRKQDTTNIQLLFLSLPSGSRNVGSTFVCIKVLEEWTS